MSALEQSFADLCAKHDLNTIGLNFHRDHEDCHFAVYVHSDGLCASGVSDDIASALTKAIAEMDGKRGPQAAFADEALPELAA